MESNSTTEIDRHFKRNTFSICAVEVFWGLGMPAVIESTFIQIFLNSLGATKTVIGLIPGAFAIGAALFSLMSAYLTSHLIHKKKAVILAHLSASIPLGLFGILLLILGIQNYTIVLFMIFYMVFAMAVGITSPVWQNFILKIYSEKNAVKAISIMMTFQIAARLLGGLCIVKLVDTFSFSALGSGIIFTAVSLVFTIGSLFFVFTYEHVEPSLEKAAERHTFKSLFQALKSILADKNYMLFLFSNLDVYVCLTLISFYANYAVEFHGISKAAAAGLFIVLIQAGSVLGGFFCGWYEKIGLKNKYILAKLFLLGSIILLFFARSLTLFLAVSFFMGLARGIQNTSYSPMVKKLSRKQDATDYFSITPGLLLPFSFLLPLLAGFYLDMTRVLGLISYNILFGFFIGFVGLSLWWIRKVHLD